MSLGFGQSKATHAAANVSTVTTSSATTQVTGSGFVVVGMNQGGAMTVSDSNSNAYTQIGTQVSYNFTNRGAAVWYCPLGVGGVGHTATVSGGGGLDMSIFFFEITTTNGQGIILDQSTVANSSTLISTAYTTTVANEVLYAIFCGASTSNPATHTASGDSLSVPATLDITNGASTLDSTGCVARRLVSATQSNVAVTFTETGNSGGTMAMFGLSFFEAGVTVAWLT
jgi:hypothetical protein